VVLVHTSSGRGLDERIFTAVPRHHSMWFRLSGALIGSEPIWVIVGIAVATAVGLRRRRVFRLAVGLSVAVVSVAMAELFKRVLLSRPSAGAAGAVSNSFPSGHAVVAAVVVVAVWFVVGDRWRGRVVVIGSVLCGLVGVATVVQQWHRPSDVVSAYALVAACACAGGAILAGRGAAD
jgi:membrane-associated phospholipid phosphatase